MTDPTWQAIELAVDPRHPRPRHAPPLSTVVAEIVHTALWTHDCGPVSYLSLPGVLRHRTLLWAGSAPADPLSVSGVECADLTDATATLGQLAVNASEATIGVSIVEIDPRPLGETSAFTERLLATEPTALTATTTREPSLVSLLAAASDYPQALSVVAERGTDTTELAVRRVDSGVTRVCETLRRVAVDGSETFVIEGFEVFARSVRGATIDNYAFERLMRL